MGSLDLDARHHIFLLEMYWLLLTFWAVYENVSLKGPSLRI